MDLWKLQLVDSIHIKKAVKRVEEKEEGKLVSYYIHIVYT